MGHGGLQLHVEAASLRFFETCWTGNGWLAVKECAAWRHHMPRLCNDWLPSTCIAGAHRQCARVSKMCGSTSTRQLHVQSLRQHRRKERQVLFMHIPKNAGTAIEEAAFQAGIHWGLHWDGGLMTMPGEKLCVRYHVPPRYLGKHSYGDAEVFCVTRHPFERAVSEYTYLLGVKWGSGFSSFLHEKDECSSAGLNHFLQGELSIFLNTTHGTKFRCDCHFLPQSDYIWDANGHQRCNKWIRMGELPGSFNEYMKEKRLPVRLRPSRVNAASCNVTVADLTEETKAMLRLVYAEDFERLGYTE